jgi:hypothetical protein
MPKNTMMVAHARRFSSAFAIAAAVFFVANGDVVAAAVGATVAAGVAAASPRRYVRVATSVPV